MIDIHCHVLYDVDDGAGDLQTSQAMIDSMARSGVTGIIATPHLRQQMFSYPVNRIEEAYHELREYAASKGVSLYLGCEYHVGHEIFGHLETGRIHTLADTNYVLTEYSHADSLDRIVNYTQELIMRGWKPVIAHAERYGVFQRNPHLAAEAADAGAGIQVNANSILGLDGRILKKTAKKLLDLDMVDYIASDAHDMGERAGHMGECYSYILKKYGNDSAQRLFEQNPGRILDEDGSIQPG